MLLVWVTLRTRRRRLQRYGGTVDCSLRLPGHLSWRQGVGQYDGDCLKWYRVFSLGMRPQRVLSRQRLAVTGRRHPAPAEVNVLPRDPVVVSCVQDGADVELALSSSALTGFLAWLESSPPGAHTHYG